MQSMRLRHVLTIFSIVFFVGVVAIWLPRFIDRTKRAASRTAQPVRIVLSRTVAFADGSTDYVQIDDRNGTTAIELEIHSATGNGARTKLPPRRTNEAATLYETLQDVGIWSLPDSAEQCSHPRKYCARVNVRFEDGDSVHERSLVFDDRAASGKARREVQVHLSDQATAADAMKTLQIESAKSEPGAYAKMQTAFDDFGGAEMRASRRQLQTAAAKHRTAGVPPPATATQPR